MELTFFWLLLFFENCNGLNWLLVFLFRLFFKLIIIVRFFLLKSMLRDKLLVLDWLLLLGIRGLGFAFDDERKLDTHAV